MKILLKWNIDKSIPITAISVDPVHNKLIVGVGKTIIMYDAITGEEVGQCEKHSQDVTCLAFRKDGRVFASGSKDNIVYFWDINKLNKPTNKITFPDPLIHLYYNPCFMILLSMSKTMVNICKEKSANKFPLAKTGVDCCWTNDGKKYAIAYESGEVLIKDLEEGGEEKQIIINEEKEEKITCICFSKQKFLHQDYVLYVCTWDKNMHLIDLFNGTVIDSKKFTSDPISMTLYKDDYIMVGTNNREINFFTKDGIFIYTITEGINSWVTNICEFDKYNSIVSCSNDGQILSHQVTFQVVHGIYNEKYVFRKNLREIVIHNLLTGEKSSIMTKRYIKKMAVFKDLVATLSNDKIFVHKINDENNAKPKYYIKWDGALNLILLASNHVLVCKENQIYSFLLLQDVAIIDKAEREWSFETEVKYLRVLGGAPKREGVLCGLRSGDIYILYLDNQFPTLIYSHDVPIKSLDISHNRKKLAIIDNNYDLTMVDLVNKKVLWGGEKAKSAAFNSDVENMIAYWYEGNTYIKTSEFPPISEKMSGVIIGFRGKKVFMLQTYNNVNVLDISNSQSIMRYAEQKNMEEGYNVACLGATKEEWIYLGFESLLNFDFQIAAKCFKQIQDIRLINLVLSLEEEMKLGVNDDIIRGDIYSNMGKYKEAAELYIKAGEPQKAQEMYALLKMYAEALEIKAKYLQGGDDPYTDSILYQQAEWLFENKKFKEAGDLYWAVGKKKKAIEIYGENKILDSLIEVCRGMTKEDSEELIALCGHYFKKHQHYEYAREAFLKLDDTKSLVYMNVDLKKWTEAFILARGNKPLSEYVCLQYAEQLILEDRFKEAQEYYRKANRVDLSMKLLEKLIDNAVFEKRYKDACYLFSSISRDALTYIDKYDKDYTKLAKESFLKIKNFHDAGELANIFGAYDYIFRYVEQPFNKDILALSEETLFNSSLFLANELLSFKTDSVQFKAILPSYIFYCLGKLTKKRECFKTARFSFERLINMNFPVSWTNEVDLETMNIRTEAYTDKESILPICPNCNHPNPLINEKGDFCTVCAAPFIRCSVSFSILPIVEFRPVESISAEEAIKMIKANKGGVLGGNINKSENKEGEYSWKIGEGSGDDDVFEEKVNEIADNMESTETYHMLEVDKDILNKLEENDVFIIDNTELSKAYPIRFFKARKGEVMVTMCKFCHKFFNLEEFENAFLQCGKCCPICKGVDDFMKGVDFK